MNIDEKDVFIEFTSSSFWSSDGLEATASVFGDSMVFSSFFG